MSTTRNLGGVFMTDVDNRLSTSSGYVSTENVCGLIFDTNGLGTVTLPAKFQNGNVVELNKAKDVEEAGITNEFLGGLVKYHLDTFFALAGDGQRLFVSFTDSSSDTNFDAVEKMQMASNGIIYQIGVWTATPLATASNEANAPYSVATTNTITKLQKAAETVGGKIGETNYDGNAPLNIILNTTIVANANCDYTKLPDLIALECPKVSVIIGQQSSDEVHAIQLAVNKLSETPTYSSVGNIGAALACLAVAPAEESIAHVANFNLGTVIQNAELGFGNLTISGNAFAAAASFGNIKTIKYADRNQMLHQKGYIFLRNHDGLENAIFFSSDQTLTNGDYRTIARCRVIHKSRRVVRTALLPYVNAPLEVESDTGTLTSSDITMFMNLVTDALDNYMVEPAAPTIPQISGREVIIDEEQDVLHNDQLLIEYYLLPIGCTSSIYVTEGFTSSIS